MDKKQFEQLMEKLEDIRCVIIDVETNTEKHHLDKKYTEPTINDIRSNFFNKLEEKTGWGRNEIKALFENSVFDENNK